MLVITSLDIDLNLEKQISKALAIMLYKFGIATIWL